LSRVRTACILFVALVCALRAANAARIDVSRLDDGGSMVLIEGDIELDDVVPFWARIATLSNATIAFRSEGGSLLAGMRIGTLIRENGFVTVVPNGARCASACAIAWLGGRQRLIGIGSKVGFHAAYVRRDHRKIESGPGNAVLGAYLFQLGLSEDAIVYVTQAEPGSMKWLSLEQAAQHGIDVSLAPEEIIHSAALTSPVVSERQQNDLERRATDFVLALAARWSSPNEEALRSVDELYADAVHYHGKPTLRQDVVLDKRRFAERWPERSYTIRPSSISVMCVKETDVCSVKGTMSRFLVSAGAKTTARDITNFEYNIAGMGEAPHIVEESSSIVDETNSLAKLRGDARVWNPLTAVSRSVGRLFARIPRSEAGSSHRMK
jgi:hypothetical protein